MSTKKVLYFLAGTAPTGGELADIATLNAAALPNYDIQVRNTDINTDGGAGVEPADYVAGTVPDDVYDGVTVLDPDALPSGLPDTSVIVSDGDTLTTADGGTVAVAVADGVATYTYTAGE